MFGQGRQLLTAYAHPYVISLFQQLTLKNMDTRTRIHMENERRANRKTYRENKDRGSNEDM